MSWNWNRVDYESLCECCEPNLDFVQHLHSLLIVEPILQPSDTILKHINSNSTTKINTSTISKLIFFFHFNRHYTSQPILSDLYLLSTTEEQKML